MVRLLIIGSMGLSPFVPCDTKATSPHMRSPLEAGAPRNTAGAKPLVSHQVIVQLIGATTTENGLTVTCDLDHNLYQKGIQVTDDEMAAINIQRDGFHGEWNYTIRPRQSSALNLGK